MTLFELVKKAIQNTSSRKDVLHLPAIEFKRIDLSSNNPGYIEKLIIEHINNFSVDPRHELDFRLHHCEINYNINDARIVKEGLRRLIKSKYAYSCTESITITKPNAVDVTKL